ncbi:MAG: hypothetical protein JO308_12965 [Verrucomicrobia bacterium]|nr:hypothetical protein [Verrucomicrobiota bacterium]
MKKSIPDQVNPDYLADTLCSLADRAVNFVVAGGVALVLHGVERITYDLDLAIDQEPANLRLFLVEIARLGFIPRAPVPPDSLLDPVIVQRMVLEKHAIVFSFWSPDEPYKQIDIFLTKENSFADLLVDAEIIQLRGRRIKVASKRKLIEMKERIRPRREKDVQDIRALSEIETASKRWS